ncbi:flagellar biosynthesis protein FlhB [bacterium]|nr:flagellar biosynthesis protein FlhB [bacterium]
MADNPTGQERTESATPRRRAKAREKGQVAKSTEVSSVVVLAVGLAGLAAFGPTMVEQAIALLQHQFRSIAAIDVEVGSVVPMARFVAGIMAAIVLPLAGVIALGGVASNVAQTGFLLTAQPILPQFSRINPSNGIKRIFSKRGAMELFKSLVKIAVVAGAVAWTVPKSAETFSSLMQIPPAAAYVLILRTMFMMAATAAIALAILAILDFFFQRIQYEEQIKMTRQEVKQEYKENEGDPQIRGKIKGLQREMSRKRMMADVETADVVVTNPIRFAVALKYDADRNAAPRVVAKGARLIAKRIREIAREAGVPIVEDPPLARALYRACEVGSEVPLSMYKAVAELLAFVYRAREKSTAGGAA